MGKIPDGLMRRLAKPCLDLVFLGTFESLFTAVQHVAGNSRLFSKTMSGSNWRNQASVRCLERLATDCAKRGKRESSKSAILERRKMRFELERAV